MGAAKTTTAKKPWFIGWAFEFLSPELKINLFGSPYEIVQQANQTNFDLAHAATNPAVQISVRKVHKDGRVGTFRGGPNAPGAMQLLDAMSANYWDAARQVLAEYPTLLTAHDEYATVLLCLNVALGQQETVKFLIANGASVNGAGKLAMTPLHWAAVHNQLETAKILLDAGADRTLQSWFFLTPANLSHANGSIAVLRLLAPGDLHASAVKLENILRAMGCAPGK